MAALGDPVSLCATAVPRTGSPNPLRGIAWPRARRSSDPRPPPRGPARCTGAPGTMPGGTDSNFRAWGDDTVYVDRGKGGMVWDIDGNEYIDLRHGLRPGDPRPRRRARRRLRQRADAPRRQLLAHLGGRGRGDGAAQGAHRLGRQGAHDRVGDRGDDARDARRPGLHRPRQDREVRGPVPRRPRLRPRSASRRTTCPSSATRTPGAPGLGPRHPGGGDATRSSRRATTTSAAAPALRARRRGDRRDHRRAGPRQRAGHPAQARLPRGDARPDRGVRHPARSSTRSRPASASRAAVRPSSSACSRTWPPTPRRWATATRRRHSAARTRS